MSGPGAESRWRDRPLVGRGEVLARLRDAVRSPGGSPAVVWLEGEAGTGKTTLLDAALDGEEGQRDPRVLRARAEPMDLGRPFAVASRLLGLEATAAAGRGTGRTADADHPTATEGVPEEDGAGHGDLLTVFDQLPGRRHRIAGKLRDRAGELTAAGPLVAVLDDVQWADDSSLWVLDGLLEADSPITVILAGRPVSGRSAPAARLLRRVGADDRWELGALGEAEVDELVAQLVGAPVGDGVRRLVDRAAGNPMLVAELVHAADRRGWLVRRAPQADRVSAGDDEGDSPAVVDLDESARPDELDPTLALSRLDELEEDERELLRVASVLGSTFTLAHLAAMVDRPAAPLVPVLAKLVARELLVERGGELGFRHDLVQEAVYGEIAGWARAALHAQAATVLREGGAPAADVVHHLRRGAPVVDPATGNTFGRAGRALLHTDPVAARTLLERAVELDPEPDGSLLADLVLATTWAGEPAVGERLARHHLADPAAAAGSPAALAVRHALAHNLVAQGRLVEAADAVEALAGATDGDGADRLLAEAALVRALAFQHGPAARTAGALLDPVEGGPRPGGDVGTCVAWCARSWVDAQEGRVEDAVRAAERALAAAAAGSEAALRYHPHYFLAQALLAADRFDRFDEVAAEGRTLSTRLGTVWQLPVWSSTIAAKHLRAGEWDRALAEAEVGLAWSDDTGSRVGAPWLWCHQALVALWRNRLDDAEALLAQAEEALGDDLRPGADGVLWVRGLLAEEHGDLDAALRSLGLLWDLVEGLGVVVRMPTIGPDVVRVALAAGERGRAARVVDALDRHAGTPWPASAVAGADRCRGLLAGDADLAVRACAGYQGAPTVTEAAMADADAAELLVASGSLERAGVHARAALAGFERLGAELLAARLRRSVGTHVLGVEGAPEDPRTLLSPAELRVAGLVATGASNPEVAEALHVSRRTVESHLSHIFTKLGIRSRVDLAVLMADNR